MNSNRIFKESPFKNDVNDCLSYQKKKFIHFQGFQNIFNYNDDDDDDDLNEFISTDNDRFCQHLLLFRREAIISF